MKNTIKNHVYVVFDSSGSMNRIIDKAVKVFNNQINFLRSESLSYEQETRVSFYQFDSTVNCLISDVDVARPIELEKIHASGMTALIDAATLAIEDAKQLPQKYGDHSFYFYLITDGGENSSNRKNIENFPNLIKSLPNNFTVISFVPDVNGKTTMKRMGIPEGNIDKWDATERGIEEVGKKMQAITKNIFEGRKKGIRSSQTVFTDLSQVTSANVKKVLDEIAENKVEIVINSGTQAVEIRPLVESNTQVIYSKGCAYYELVKNEHVQPQKEIIIQNKKNGKFYSGDNARKLLNLPNQEVKIVPGDFGEWIVYVQSTSVNRKVIPKQRVLVLK